MSKSLGIHFPPISETVTTPDGSTQTQKSTPKFVGIHSSSVEFQTLTQLLAQKIQSRASSLPHAQEFILSQKAAVEEEIVSRLTAAPRRARKF